jgi:hypothetical protein
MKIRKHRRVKINKEVTVTRTFKAQGLDLSEEGMYIYSRSYFIPGSIINVSFRIDDEPLDITAKVRHIQPGVGFGVCFYDLKESVAERIRGYLSSIESGATVGEAAAGA